MMDIKWLPMTFAPKDGTPILLWIDKPEGRQVFVGAYSISEHTINGKVTYRSARWWIEGASQFDEQPIPAMWAQLPEPSPEAVAAIRSIHPELCAPAPEGER